MFTWAQVTESILSNSFDHLMCHLCKNSWEISWVESHKHVTVETHKSYVWLVQSASCLTCSIQSFGQFMHTNNVADVTATSTLCKTSRGGPDALAGWIWTPSRLFVSPVPTETPPEICFYSKRKNDLFRPSETHPAGPVQFPVTHLWRVSTN